jgi:hypothetical protein
MALKPNQLQVTTIDAQANAIIERVHKVVDYILRSFDLENEISYENLELEEDNPFGCFLQSTAWAIRSTYHTTLHAGNTMSTCVWQRYDPQYRLQSKLGSNTKRKQDIINNSNQKENKNYS